LSQGLYYPVALGHHPFRIYVAAVEVLRHHLPQRRLLTVGVEVLALWVGGNEAVPLTWRGQQRPGGMSCTGKTWSDSSSTMA
jgi:hypothetical protein